MHVQTSVKVVQAVLLQVFIEQGIAIHGSIHAIISHNIRIQLQTISSSSVILGIRTITSPIVALSHGIAHMDDVLVGVVVVHERAVVHAARGVYHVAG